MAEYARRQGITREAVRQAVTAGRLETNGKVGRACRVRGVLDHARNHVAGRDSGYLAEARLEKLRADIEVQRQKLEINERERRKEI
ncbi:MAG: hypothetical protein IJU70_10630, partial [Lentisphaeria bacterium]|nr:hypothetical protein [Lentisphaeria bacterium]